MTIVKGFMQMTGSIQGVSFYTVKGSDKVIMRTKGGATKKQIAKSPRFENTRKQNMEFGGCSKFGSKARRAFGGLQRIADYNINPVLNGMGKNLMKLDTVSEIGRRNLKLSQNKEILEGFNFNRTYPFNTVVRISPQVELDRELLQATVTVPRINTDVDLLNIQKLPYFRLLVAIGTVSDMAYQEAKNQYKPLVPDLHGASNTTTGEWQKTQSIVPEQSLTVQLNDDLVAELTDDVTVLLSLAVEFGNIGMTDEPVEVKYAGCGRVLAVK
ncbi:MAG: hypothetical protein Q8904_09895 [Bacteroidota bacterium]|nr:hypothetical protein [Bacteroidota bacterium]